MIAQRMHWRYEWVGALDPDVYAVLTANLDKDTGS